jgi:hypothetical protein
MLWSVPRKSPWEAWRPWKVWSPCRTWRPRRSPWRRNWSEEALDGAQNEALEAL